jgi:hypothetical protein
MGIEGGVMNTWQVLHVYRAREQLSSVGEVLFVPKPEPRTQ